MEDKPSIVVTGAGSGIGRALAREWARRGHALGLTGRRIEILEEVRAEIAADPAAKTETAGRCGSRSRRSTCAIPRPSAA